MLLPPLRACFVSVSENEVADGDDGVESSARAFLGCMVAVAEAAAYRSVVICLWRMLEGAAEPGTGMEKPGIVIVVHLNPSSRGY